MCVDSKMPSAVSDVVLSSTRLGIMNWSANANVIVHLELNDIFNWLNKPEEDVTPDQMIAGLKQLALRARTKGLRVYGGTLVPFENQSFRSSTWKPEREKTRQAVNEWIRESGGAFDAVIDFDKAVRDPSHPARMRGETRMAGGSAQSQKDTMAAPRICRELGTSKRESDCMNSTATQPDSFPGHDGGHWSPVQSEVVASWPKGHFAENLAIDAAGLVYVSLHSHNRIDRIDPKTGKVEEFARLTAPAAGLAFDAAGSLWVTGGVVGEGPGYIWCIRSNQPEVWVEIPDAVFMNGCTPHVDGRTLLVCESVTGRILGIDQKERRWSVWLGHDRLRPKSPQKPGANGIKVLDEWAWISVTDHNQLVRSKIAADGGAGPIELVAEEVRADDFAFGESGAAYIATHPAQTVLRLHPDGRRETIAGPHEGAVGSTACAFGRQAADRKSLYVTTTGGLRYPYREEIQDAKLLRLNIGEPGQPLLPETKKQTAGRQGTQGVES